jgi:predicted nucleotidyltransferase
VLDEIVRRVVESAAPEKIILFGSAARGDMDRNSDVDLLVVKAGDYDKRRLTGDIYEALYGVPEAVDVVLVTPEQVDRHRNSWMLVIHHALRHGMVVYAAT